MENFGNTACTASKREKTASADLAIRLITAKEELSDAIAEADFDRMTALRAEIKSLPELITIAEVRETKERLNQIEVDLQKNDEKKRLIRDVVAKCKLELHEKEMELQPLVTAYTKIGWEQSIANTEYEDLLQRRRECKAKLFSLSESLRGETD